MKKSKTKKNIEFSDKSILVFISLIIVILLVSLLAQWQLFDKFDINDDVNSNSKNSKDAGVVGGQVTLQIIEPPTSLEDNSNTQTVDEGVSKK